MIWIEIVILLVISFIQNFFFTWRSRSRNSGNPSYHRIAAFCSNFIWYFTNILIVKQAYNATQTGNWGLFILTAFLYAIASTEGSVIMMKYLLTKEKGSRKVGAYAKKAT